MSFDSISHYQLRSNLNKVLLAAQVTFPTKKLRQVVEPDSNMFLEVTERHPEILQRILSTLLNVVMFEDCKNQWSMSRPLFVLILLYEDYFRYTPLPMCVQSFINGAESF